MINYSSNYKFNFLFLTTNLKSNIQINFNDDGLNLINKRPKFSLIAPTGGKNLCFFGKVLEGWRERCC